MDPHTSNRGRDLCHSSRDEFFDACAPAALTPAGSTCANLRATYESACLASWRLYWEERVKRGRPILGRTRPVFSEAMAAPPQPVATPIANVVA